MRPIALLLTVTTAASCYRYSPPEEVQPGPGQEVRVRLADTEAERMTDRLGRSVRAVDGRLLKTTPDSLALDVWWGARYAGTPFADRRDTLALARADVTTIEVRELSRGRTAAALAAGGVGAVFVLQALIRGSRANAPPRRDDPPVGAVLPPF